MSSVTRPKPSPPILRAAAEPVTVAQAVPCAERSRRAPVRAVILPGSGSDDVFVRSAFTAPLAVLGIILEAPAPRPGAGVVDGYRAALDAAAATPGPLLVGGVSLGAHVATAWAAAHRAELGARLLGVLAALPAWTGAAPDAPAALAARATADHVRAGGVAAAVAQAGVGTPPWLATELGRAWPRYGDGLAAALDAAAAEPGPAEPALAGLDVPVGLAALVDDPVHPVAVARRWAVLLPRGVVVCSSLATFGADPQVAGRAALLGWLRAGGTPCS